MSGLIWPHSAKLTNLAEPPKSRPGQIAVEGLITRLGHSAVGDEYLVRPGEGDFAAGYPIAVRIYPGFVADHFVALFDEFLHCLLGCGEAVVGFALLGGLVVNAVAVNNHTKIVISKQITTETCNIIGWYFEV